MHEEITPEENERRFQVCLEQIRKLTREDLVKLMGKEWVEDYRRRFQYVIATTKWAFRILG
jgi:hypothetical protein